ncbi:MAG: chemotaxis protein CheA [Phenylobacterium sp.]
MNEFIEQFLVECRELVEQATADLLALEDRPEDRERLDSGFRAFHTLKGAAGIVEFADMEAALHAAEDVLSAVRSGAEPLTPTLIGDCLSCLDQVVQWLDAMEVSGEPPSDARAASDAIVARFASRTTSPPRGPAEIGGPAPEAGRSGLDDKAEALLAAQVALLADPTAEPSPGRAASAGVVAVNLLLHAGRAEEAGRLRHVLARAVAAQDSRAVQDALRSLQAGALIAEPAAAAPIGEPAEPAARGLRVDIERVDALVSLTGELTVAKNALGHAAGLARDGVDPASLAVVLKDQHAVLDRLVTELQRSVLNIRVLPLRHVFQRFPRLVREMVVSLGKPARLVTQGDATEADKAIVENLFEPLLHVMRNALDHGIESPEARAAAGKPPSATISLRASQQGDRVVVEVADDGGGVDLDRVRAVAVERGIVSAAGAAELSDQGVVDLIFAPGFTTAGAVSSLSGRGVGMDAVRSAVARLGGHVAVASRPGEGTTVRFVLPFTVMMNAVMTVEVGGQLFGIPMEGVSETLRLPREEIAPIGATRAFVLRERTIPLIELAEVLGADPRAASSGDARVVVVEAGGQIGALEVDRVGERMDVMLKPMDGLLAGTPGIAGTTLLGDGRVLIVLDLMTLLL